MEENIKGGQRGKFLTISLWNFLAGRAVKICVCVTLEREFVVRVEREKEGEIRQSPLYFTSMFADYLSCVDVAA